MAATFSASHYYTYAELTELMESWVMQYGDVCDLGSIGTSAEGREIWILTGALTLSRLIHRSLISGVGANAAVLRFSVTDASTGPHTEKPAMWLDANTHAGEVRHHSRELFLPAPISSLPLRPAPPTLSHVATFLPQVTGCTAVLDFTNTVLAGYAVEDDAMVRLLETSTLYIVPRLCPDGAELYLTTPYTCRSTPILWPPMPADIPGFRQEDVDGDGHITMMRIPDPGGNYKISSADPRMMVPRLPEEDAGELLALKSSFSHINTHV